MKLIQIWNAQFAWAALSALNVSPELSYKLMTFGDKFDEEMAKCEKLRVKCACEVAGVEPGSAEAQAVSLSVGSAEFAEYQVKLTDALQVESNLEVIGMGVSALVKALSAKKENAISKADLKLLEPFFKEASAPDLKLVEKA